VKQGSTILHKRKLRFAKVPSVWTDTQEAFTDPQTHMQTLVPACRDRHSMHSSMFAKSARPACRKETSLDSEERLSDSKTATLGKSAAGPLAHNG
jgi:hypothetical protein